MPRLTFHGAAETVTGSKYLLEAGSSSVLIDCGQFQGVKSLRQKNWEPLPFDPAAVDAVIATHAHIDHIGYLPRFVAQGFRGPIWSSFATRDLAELLLLDAAENQERDAEYANRKKFSKHHPALPLFTTQDAIAAWKRFEGVPRQEWHAAAKGIRFRYHDAGHLLGSNMVEVETESDAGKTRILFSGDVGRYDAPLYHDPSPPPACDYLICESTYGDREHPRANVMEDLAEVVGTAIRRGGVLLIASFAVGRAQQLIYLLQVLMAQGDLPVVPIYLDSPMAVDATGIYRHYHEDHDLSEAELANSSGKLDGRHVHLVRTVSESKALNDIQGPAVIISSSGMMTGGRILFHLKRRLPEPKNTILIGGFMAYGTRGRTLVEGAKFLRIHGRDVRVKSHIANISSLSGHAGRGELLRWLEPLPPPRRVFLTHGEKRSADALAETLREDRGWDVCVPKLGESFELEATA